ncbi:unnamed protein product [Prorocentrum cordatum]|uniref:Uncharacterized protein n=1 Tax=Prorocentrum cordatum TaxID=2364126 RepID=A0ABN9YAA6_9DINO|nr:unnamed protein product [Polarella glacialis]
MPSEATAGAAAFSRKRSFLALASKKARETRGHSEDRVLGMLVLTASPGPPGKAEEAGQAWRKHVNGSFRGYRVGEVINDHDAALAYVLEFYPSVLPSFAALPKDPDSRRA